VEKTVERLVDPQLVLFDVEADSKEQVIRALSEQLLQLGRISDLEGYVSEVLEREGTSSTAVGFSLATPHAKSEFVTEATIGFARLANELAWDDEESVKLVFLIAVPIKDKGDRHLQILAKLFRKFVDEHFRATISEATNAAEIVALIDDIS
jgi:fructose-specific phosphotransferase system IIA component